MKRDKKYGWGGIVAGVTSGDEEWEATGSSFKDERGRWRVPCRRVDDHAVTRDMPLSSFARIPKTSKRRLPPVEAGDLSVCGQVCAIGMQHTSGGQTCVRCVWLDKPDEIVVITASNFRRGFKTSMRHGVNPIAFGEKYGGWRIDDYGGSRETNGEQLYAGTCEDCGFESRTLQAGDLRGGVRHECCMLRDRTGFTANGYTVVRKQWHDDAVYWLVRHGETGEEDLWSPSRVEVELVGDLRSLDNDCAKAIRDAAFKGEDSPILRDIGTTVAEVQFYLPMNHYTSGDQLGHIFPKKLCLTPRARVASWHPRLLRWIDKTKNTQMGSLAWLEQYVDPVVVVSSQELVAMWLEDLFRLFPDGRKGHLQRRGGISKTRRKRFGLPTLKAVWAAWRREAAAIEAIYDGYGILTNLDGSESNGG